MSWAQDISKVLGADPNTIETIGLLQQISDHEQAQSRAEGRGNQPASKDLNNALKLYMTYQRHRWIMPVFVGLAFLGAATAVTFIIAGLEDK